MKKYSGKWVQRIPPKLHAKLAAEAKEQGVSLNMYVALILAENQGYREGLRAPKK